LGFLAIFLRPRSFACPRFKFGVCAGVMFWGREAGLVNVALAENRMNTPFSGQHKPTWRAPLQHKNTLDHG
jgi:hypothetical protein